MELLLFLLAFLPVIIGGVRKHKNLGAIAVSTIVSIVLGLVTGGVGGVLWFIPLIWSFTDNVEPK